MELLLFLMYYVILIHPSPTFLLLLYFLYMYLPHFSLTLSVTVPERNSAAVLSTSCQQSADVRGVWMTVAHIMATLTVATICLSVFMGFLLFVKSKRTLIKEMKFDPSCGMFEYDLKDIIMSELIFSCFLNFNVRLYSARKPYNLGITEGEIATPSPAIPDAMIYTENVSYNFQDVSILKSSQIHTAKGESAMYEELQETPI